MASVPQYGSPSLASPSATRSSPKATAATSASPIPSATVRWAPPTPRAWEASTTPATASPMPAACAVLGRSPVSTPVRTGMTAAVAEIGATTLIGPTARPR